MFQRAANEVGTSKAGRSPYRSAFTASESIPNPTFCERLWRRRRCSSSSETRRLRSASGAKSTREIEREIVTKLLLEAYETMSPEQKRELLLSLKIRDHKLLLAPGGVEAARLAIQHSGFAVFKGSVIVANAAAQQLLGHGLSLATNAALPSGRNSRYSGSTRA